MKKTEAHKRKHRESNARRHQAKIDKYWFDPKASNVWRSINDVIAEQKAMYWERTKFIWVETDHI